MMPKPQPTFPAEFKHEAVQLARTSSKPKAQIARELGISDSALYSWRIASQKSFFVRFKHLFSSDSVLVAPPRLHLRSSTLEQERTMAYVTEKEEDVP
jgi:transposase-like protein